MNCNNCGVAESATKRIKKDRDSIMIKKLVIVCSAALLAVLIVCGTILGCYTVKKQQETIIEQQYALNMQYAGLLDYINSAEITTTQEASADGDGSIAVSGNNNTTAGGDINSGE